MISDEKNKKAKLKTSTGVVHVTTSYNKRIRETPCKDACASEKLVHYWLRGGEGGQCSAQGKHSVVRRLNGGVDCLVVKISLGGRLFAAAHCATASWKRRRLYRETFVGLSPNLGQSSASF